MLILDEQQKGAAEFTFNQLIKFLKNNGVKHIKESTIAAAKDYFIETYDQKLYEIYNEIDNSYDPFVIYDYEIDKLEYFDELEEL